MTVLEFPPKLSLRRNVSTESRYGTNSFFLNEGRLDVEEELMEFSAMGETTGVMSGKTDCIQSLQVGVVSEEIVSLYSPAPFCSRCALAERKKLSAHSVFHAGMKKLHRLNH